MFLFFCIFKPPSQMILHAHRTKCAKTDDKVQKRCILFYWPLFNFFSFLKNKNIFEKNTSRRTKWYFLNEFFVFNIVNSCHFRFGHYIGQKIFKKSIFLNKKIPSCSSRWALFKSVFIPQIRRAVDQIQQWKYTQKMNVFSFFLHFQALLSYDLACAYQKMPENRWKSAI